jgi:hypothetical protein
VKYVPRVRQVRDLARRYWLDVPAAALAPASRWADNLPRVVAIRDSKDQPARAAMPSAAYKIVCGFLVGVTLDDPDL